MLEQTAGELEEDISHKKSRIKVITNLILTKFQQTNKEVRLQTISEIWLPRSENGPQQKIISSSRRTQKPQTDSRTQTRKTPLRTGQRTSQNGRKPANRVAPPRHPQVGTQGRKHQGHQDQEEKKYIQQIT